MMDVAHESYSSDFQCLTEDQERRQKVADARYGGPGGGGAAGGATGGGSGGGEGKALPTPGEILRMNAARGVVGSGVGQGGADAAAAVGAKKEAAEPSLKTKEDIMRLIAEEDVKFKAKKANVEAAETAKAKREAWQAKHREKGAAAQAGGEGASEGGGGKSGGGGGKSGGGGKAGGSGGEKSGGGGSKRGAPQAPAEPAADGSWMNAGKKSKKK
jgi:hypothetical protein